MDDAERSLRYITLSDEELRALERERPGLVVRADETLLIGWPAGGALDLQYAFSDRVAFARQFAPMLRRVLPAVDPDEAPLGMRFRLTGVDHDEFEPVLFAEGFSFAREWLRLELDGLPPSGSTSDAVAPGFRLRRARPDDAETIVQLDAVAFPAPEGTAETVASDIKRHHMGVLEDVSTGRAAGFLEVHKNYAPAGYVSNIALHPDFRRRGLGEAMMRWALAWFREQGLRSAALQVNTDNAPAIALYHKLGFVVSESGCDYRRPIGEDEPRAGSGA